MDPVVWIAWMAKLWWTGQPEMAGSSPARFVLQRCGGGKHSCPAVFSMSLFKLCIMKHFTIAYLHVSNMIDSTT